MSKDDKSASDNLNSLYQAAKQSHPMPAELKHKLMAQCETRQKRTLSWRSWWQFSQLVMGCAAMVMLFNWIQWSPASAIYQIEVSSHADFQQVQWHRLEQPGSTVANKAVRDERLQQQWQRQLEQIQRSGSIHTRTAQLQQQEASWQLTICDELQLNLSKDLVAQLQLGDDILQIKAPQWVELELAASGQVLAIRATEQVLHCPQLEQLSKPLAG